MRWIVYDKKPQKGEEKPEHVHRPGLKGGCMHPLFGLGVAAAIVALGYVLYRLILAG
ncbi:hypothetical protein [Marimonas lutisalis]|uniref:hypothetical protein n=1 Tax=Marimonas lutisalis TaxID=2545756 RepID=UPI001375E4EF|nr:hypothetical protein [Marimonas lutisalis]